MDPRAALPRLLAAAALGGGAWWIRGFWIPLERHRFDGHELDYLRAFQGAAPPESTRLYPALAGLYQLMGTITQDPSVLLWLALTLGVISVGLSGVAIGRRFGERAGWLGAALIAAHPIHAFWSSSAYNVMLPQALLTGAVAARGWWGAGLYAAACLFRLELALLAPAVAVLAGPKAAVGAVGGLLMLPLLQTAPALRAPWEVLPVNLLLPGFLGPLGAPLGLVAVALAVRRESAGWLAAAGWVHLVGACFDDYGGRHGLTGGLALAGVVGAGLSYPEPNSAKWSTLRGLVGVAALVLSLLGCQEVARWYYAPAATFEQIVPAMPPPPPCAEIQDDPLAPESHWNPWPEGPEHKSLTRPDPVCWREEAIHYQWNSRGLMDRRLRMHRAYDLAPIGVVRHPAGSRIYYAVAR